MKFEIRKSRRGRWHAKLKSGNGNSMWTTQPRGYKRRRTAVNAVNRAKQSHAAPVVFV